MRKTTLLTLVAALALVATGCAHTPPSVKLAMDMQSGVMSVVEENTFGILDAYNAEVKAAAANRYAAEFARAEDAMERDDGSVNLEQYKKVAEAFATEIAKATSYYDDQCEAFKTKLKYQFMVAGRLRDSVKAYQEENGLDPEGATQLINSISELAVASIEAMKQAEAQEDTSSYDWDDILDLIRRRAANYVGSAVGDFVGDSVDDNISGIVSGALGGDG